MRKITFLFLTVFFLTACKDTTQKQEDINITYHKKDFGAFSLNIPDDWKEIKENGPDFTFQTFLDAQNDTFGIYVGRFAQYPEFQETIIFEPFWQHQLDTMSEKPSYDYVVGDKRTMDRNRINHRNILFETINGINTRFIFPRDRQQGNVQFYVDSLGENKTQVDFWGRNLPADKQDVFFKVCRTLKAK
jgi:hypothetical protein